MGRGPSTIVVIISAPVADGDIPGLCDRLAGLLARCDVSVVVCDVGGLVEPGLGTVDALARLALVARQHGAEICLRDVTPELEELLSLTGLGTCAETFVFIPDMPPMNSSSADGRTGENALEEDPS